MINANNTSIILFDGVCNLCNSSIQFIIKRDLKHRFQFSSLQSDASHDILLQFQLKNSNLDSIILIENGKIYQKSTAILKIFKNLTSLWRLSYIFIIIPKFIRDFVYDIVAKYRYKWFGEKNSCMIPSKELKNRFL